MSHPNDPNDDNENPRDARPEPQDDEREPAHREAAEDLGTEEHAQEPPD